MKGFVAAADPVSKTAQVFTDGRALDIAIQSHGFIPLRPDGAQMIVQQFEGGIILDGAPINVWMGAGWFEGQRELLAPYWENGTVPTPIQSVLNDIVVPMPEDVRLNYENFKNPPSAGIFGDSKGVLMIGLGVGLFMLFRGGKKSPRASSHELPYA